MQRPLLVVLFATLVTANVNQCRSQLLKGCDCGKIYFESQTLFTVNCTNLSFRNTDMLQELPEETQMLIFTGNHIPVLEMNVFGEDLDLSELKIVDMSNNGIREIKGKAFHHVPSVQRLILNHNNISIANEDDGNFHHPRVFSNFYNLKELHLTNAFADNTDAALANDLHDIFVNSNLTKLYKLHLEQNEIKFFKDENVFCDLPDLHDIYLGDNNIPKLNFNLRCLKKLRYLDLENNNITKFSEADLSDFDSLVAPTRHFTLEIRGNPFRCDQAIRNLYNWLLKTQVEVRNKDHLECHQAKYGNKYILNLKNLAAAKHAKISQGITVLLIVLTIVLLTLLATYAYLKKDKVKTRFGPVVEALTRKVHYTTIDSQDV
ncbi:trophoblast glycoprotein [Tribolium madens]|uniref:trophoblast glycoprotein n=1 Tax=Tribolium madens TaxID=41895 RepID=UPI001CF73C3F|nr:trophoblast glycoprotein [Tribolium madens]